MELGTLNFTLGGQTQKFTGIPLVCTCLWFSATCLQAFSYVLYSL